MRLGTQVQKDKLLYKIKTKDSEELNMGLKLVIILKGYYKLQFFFVKLIVKVLCLYTSYF